MGVNQITAQVVIALVLSAGVVAEPALTFACFAVAMIGWLIGLSLGGARPR